MGSLAIFARDLRGVVGGRVGAKGAGRSVLWRVRQMPGCSCV